MDKPPIYIPTWGRMPILTLQNLPPVLKDRVVLVVDTHERGESVGKFKLRWLVCPFQGVGIGYVRDWIVQHCVRKKIPCCIMLDDDIRFWVAYFKHDPLPNQENSPDKLGPLRKYFRGPKEGELVSHFDVAEKMCMRPNVGFVSFTQKRFNKEERAWVRNRDCAHTCFVNVANVTKSGASFSIEAEDTKKFIIETIEARLEVWADSYLSVTKIGSHGIGGESEIGNRGERQEAALRLLAARYPKYIKLYETDMPTYRRNYKTRLAPVYFLHNLWCAVERGQSVRSEEI